MTWQTGGNTGAGTVTGRSSRCCRGVCSAWQWRQCLRTLQCSRQPMTPAATNSAMQASPHDTRVLCCFHQQALAVGGGRDLQAHARQRAALVALLQGCKPRRLLRSIRRQPCLTALLAVQLYVQQRSAAQSQRSVHPSVQETGLSGADSVALGASCHPTTIRIQIQQEKTLLESSNVFDVQTACTRKRVKGSFRSASVLRMAA